MKEQKRMRPPFFKLASGLFLLLGGMAGGFTWWLHHSNVEFLQSVTGITWPNSTKHIYITEDKADIKSFWMEAHISIPQDQAQTFIRSYGFRKDPATPPLHLFNAGALPPEFQAPLPSAELYSLQKVGGPNPYEMMLDAKSGSLWMHVEYPD